MTDIDIQPGKYLTIRREGDRVSGSKSQGTIRLALGASVTIRNPGPTPPPDPTPVPPPTPTGLFIAPTGNDSNPGTIELPKRTILAASAFLAPGQTLWCRGGTYTGQGGYNWKSSGTVTAPVSIKAFPGEAPLFNGLNQSHAIIVSGSSHVVIEGLSFTGFGMGPSGDAAVLLLNAADIAIRRCLFNNNGVGFQQDHHVYINSGCRDIVIEDCGFDGTPGAAVHLYHDPGPINVRIARNRMTNGYWGVVIGSNANGVQMIENTFANNISNMDNQRGTNVTASGNVPSDVIS